MEISCLVCGKPFMIPDFIDTDSYDGQLTCPECKSLLHVKLGKGKVKKYELVEKKLKDISALESAVIKKSGGKLDVASIAKYNPLRDFLASYRATQLQLAFEQIEGILGTQLETEAYTFKSWWENNEANPQAIAWLASGWEVVDVNLQQRRVIFRKVGQR